MQRFVIHPSHPQPRLVRLAAQIVRDGGLIAYPTDGCYAFGGSLERPEAARAMRELRGLDERHPLALVCADLAQVGRYARLDNWQFRIVRQGAPGPYTFLLPATREVPKRVRPTRHSTIGVRVPSDAIALAILAELGGPMLSSSLILAGAGAPLADPDRIADALARQVGALVDGGTRAAVASTVVDLTEPPGRIVRRGHGDPAALGL